VRSPAHLPFFDDSPVLLRVTHRASLTFLAVDRSFASDEYPTSLTIVCSRDVSVLYPLLSFLLDDIVRQVYCLISFVGREDPFFFPPLRLIHMPFFFVPKYRSILWRFFGVMRALSRPVIRRCGERLIILFLIPFWLYSYSFPTSS